VKNFRHEGAWHKVKGPRDKLEGLVVYIYYVALQALSLGPFTLLGPSALDSDVLQSIFGDNTSETGPSPGPIRDALGRAQGGIVIVHLDSSQLLSAFPQLLSSVQHMFHLSEEQVARLRGPNRAYIIATLHDTQVGIVPGSAQVLSRETFPLAVVEDGVSTSLSACLTRVWIRNDLPSAPPSGFHPARTPSSSLTASFEQLDD
jgi:hypothetical protein